MVDAAWLMVRIPAKRRPSLQVRMQVIDHGDEIKYRQARVAVDRRRVGGRSVNSRTKARMPGCCSSALSAVPQDFLLDHRQIDFGIGFGKHVHPFLALFEAQEVQASSANWWYQGNCASTSCTNCASGQPSAKARMYLRLRGENPFMSGKASRKSCASRSTTLAPQPCAACRARMSRPICQYSSTSSRLTASVARCWALWIRPLRSAPVSHTGQRSPMGPQRVQVTGRGPRQTSAPSRASSSGESRRQRTCGAHRPRQASTGEPSRACRHRRQRSW